MDKTNSTVKNPIIRESARAVKRRAAGEVKGKGGVWPSALSGAETFHLYNELRHHDSTIIANKKEIPTLHTKYLHRSYI
jgi:hypothetical protein